MRINTNLNAMIATNQMSKNTALSGASMEKLSTGLRITKAGDDATGLAISEKMRAQIRGMEQADRNVQDGISMVQTAEGALEEIGNITQRMRELTVQASNETNTADDRTKITEELTQLRDEITRISESTTFNNEKILTGNGKTFDMEAMDTDGLTGLTIDNAKASDILAKAESIKFTATSATGSNNSITLDIIGKDGVSIKSQTIKVALAGATGTGTEINFDALGIKFTATSGVSTGDAIKNIGLKDDGTVNLRGTGTKNVTIQAGANNEASNSLSINIDAMNADELGITNDLIEAIADEDTKAGTTAATEFIDTLDEALSKINSSRSQLGAQQNRLEYTSSNLLSSTENLTAAESRIRDVDVAKEMVKLSKLNILNQASQAMVSQAKQQPESVSQLLR